MAMRAADLQQFLRCWMLRIAEHGPRVALFDDFPAGQHHHARGVVANEVIIV